MKAGTSSSWMFSSCKSHRTDAYDWSGEDCPWILCQRFLFEMRLLAQFCSLSVFFGEFSRFHRHLLEPQLLDCRTVWSSVCLQIEDLSNVIFWFWTDWQGEKDDKIIAVCADDPEYRHYKDIKELPPHRLAEIRRFFEDCILAPNLKLLQLNFANWQQNFMCIVVSNCGSLTLSADKKNENKEVAVDDFLGAESAVKAIGHSM